MTNTGPGRRRIIAGALAAATLAGCAGGGAKPQPCASVEECPAAARCLQQVCVANAPPVAVIAAPPAALVANALVSLDGSGSYDPDAPGDSIVSHAWTLEPLDAPCAPPVVAGTGPQAMVRFACPGRYRVSLVVTDELSAPSAPAHREVGIGAASAALVTAVPDRSVGHRCAGDPLRCAPDADVTLGATVAGAVGPVTYRWSVIPPADRPLGEDRRVSFLPGADDPAPAALLETDAAAISGDWTFVVEASDAAGSLGRAITRVSVGNSDPTLSAAVREFPHRYDRDTAQFQVSDALDVAVVDPDGDPVPERTVTLRHAGDGGALFTGEDLGDRIGFNVIVPASLGASFLLGAPGLSRTIELAVRDVNGAGASASWPVVVGNRPPAFALEPRAVAVDHAFDAAGLRYVATAALSAWSDADGDPLEQAAPTGDPTCATFRVEDGQVVVDCALEFGGVPALGNFAGSHTISQQVRDPWATSPSRSIVPLTILNRAPRIDATPPPEAQTACAATADCCEREPVAPHACLAWDASYAAAPFTLSGRFFDEDGDPLALSPRDSTTLAATPPPVCAPAQCEVDVTVRARVACGESTSDDLAITASDGALSVTETIPLGRSCVFQ